MTLPWNQHTEFLRKPFNQSDIQMKSAIFLLLSTVVFSLLSEHAQAQSFFSKPMTTVNIQIINNSDDPGIARIKATGNDGKIWLESDKIFAAKQTTGWVERLPQGSKLSWNYTLPTLATAIELPSREVSSLTGGTQDIIETVSPLQRYNDIEAIAKLKQIAGELSLEKNPIQLKKAQEQMGSYWIGDEKGTQVGPGWQVRTVDISADGTIRFENSISISGNTLLSASAEIPLIAQMQANFESGQLYKVVWRAEHFTYSNSAMMNQLPSTSIDYLKEINSSLKASQNSQLCYVRQAKVLKYVAHSVTKGTKVAYNASIAKSTIFSASGSYIFDASDSTLSALTDQVVKMEYSCIPRADIINYINSRIESNESNKNKTP